jgi:hypothetical protein
MDLYKDRRDHARGQLPRVSWVVRGSLVGCLLALLGGTGAPLGRPASAQAAPHAPVLGQPVPVSAPASRLKDDDDDGDGCTGFSLHCAFVTPACPPIVKVKVIKVVQVVPVTRIVKVFVPVTRIVKVFVPVPVIPTAPPPTPPTTKIKVVVSVPGAPAPTATPTPSWMSDPGDPLF